MKRTWIKVKRGLVVSPEHRERMGVRIWLYLFMCDLARWENGVIDRWKDEEYADEFGMELRTLREQRRLLETEGYILCRQRKHDQSITITNWTNPREYPSRVTYNSAKGVRKDGTPTSNSHLTTLKDSERYVDDPFEDPPPQKKGRDPLLDHHAIITYRDKHKFHIPKDWRSATVEVVGDHEEEWKQFLHKWQGMGWRPHNIAGMLDAFPRYLKTGKLGKPKREDAEARLRRRLNR